MITRHELIDRVKRGGREAFDRAKAYGAHVRDNGGITAELERMLAAASTRVDQATAHLGHMVDGTPTFEGDVHQYLLDSHIIGGTPIFRAHMIPSGFIQQGTVYDIHVECEDLRTGFMGEQMKHFPGFLGGAFGGTFSSTELTHTDAALASVDSPTVVYVMRQQGGHVTAVYSLTRKMMEETPVVVGEFGIYTPSVTRSTASNAKKMLETALIANRLVADTSREDPLHHMHFHDGNRVHSGKAAVDALDYNGRHVAQLTPDHTKYTVHIP